MKTETERIIEKNQNNSQNVFLEPNPIPMDAIKKLKAEKSKWMGKKTFVGMCGNMDKGLSKILIKEGGEYEPFYPKFVSVEEFSRKRELSKEIGP